MPFFATTQRNSMSTGVEDCASLGEDSGAEEEESKKGRHAKYVISTPGPKPFESWEHQKCVLPWDLHTGLYVLKSLLVVFAAEPILIC